MTRDSVQIQALSKSFGDFKALEDVSFSIPRGQFTCLLGPSGCGKTTLLRCLAGLESPSQGAIIQDGQDITAWPPSRRDFGIVFQSYALFPNLSVFDNIAFGLVNARRDRASVRERVDHMLALVGLQGQDHKFPAQLSGGQQQRVALARALAPAPALLLLDEPLSALDAKVRTRLRREIRELQSRLNVTTIMVTHDQEEAQTMADRIVVLQRGRVEQMGTPEQIYDEPATAFVADFIGEMNFLDAVVAGPGQVRLGDQILPLATGALSVGQHVRCAVRPEHLQTAGSGMSASPSAANTLRLPALVTGSERAGAVSRLHVRLEGLAADLVLHQSAAAAGPAGQRIEVQMALRDLRTFDAQSGARLTGSFA